MIYTNVVIKVIKSCIQFNFWPREYTQSLFCVHFLARAVVFWKKLARMTRHERIERARVLHCEININLGAHASYTSFPPSASLILLCYDFYLQFFPVLFHQICFKEKLDRWFRGVTENKFQILLYISVLKFSLVFIKNRYMRVFS